jgi:hypothetical protein
VHCARLNKKQRGALGDEKVVCQPRPMLIKKGMPGLVPGIFIWRTLSQTG